MCMHELLTHTQERNCWKDCPRCARSYSIAPNLLSNKWRRHHEGICISASVFENQPIFFVWRILLNWLKEQFWMIQILPARHLTTISELRLLLGWKVIEWITQDIVKNFSSLCSYKHLKHRRYDDQSLWSLMVNDTSEDRDEKQTWAEACETK